MELLEESFPKDIDQLIRKCEEAILLVKEKLADKNCPYIKDLYLLERGHRQKDFLRKLNIQCNSFLNKNNLIKNEVKGLYVFASESIEGNWEPIYLGISRTVFRRLYQHVWGKKHNEATLAFIMAKQRLLHVEKRNTLLISELIKEQAFIKNLKLVIVPEENDYALYFMEVYMAGRLKSKWNSFRTH